MIAPAPSASPLLKIADRSDVEHSNHPRLGAFSPIIARDYLATEPEPIRWLWDDFIAEGSLTVLSAYAKTGKSTLITPLMLSIAHGDPFLGRATCKTPILYLAVEEHPRDVHLRLVQFGITPDDPMHIAAGRLLPSEFPRIGEYVRRQKIGLVVLDTLASFWNVEDENDNAEVGRAVRPWLDLARATNAAVLLVHHDRKSGGPDGKGVRGGSALFGAVDQLITLDRRHGGAPSERTLKSLGRYGPMDLVIDYTEGEGYVVVAGPGEESDAALQQALRGPEPKTLEELSRATGIARASLQRRLETLGDRVERTGEGKRGDPVRYAVRQVAMLRLSA